MTTVRDLFRKSVDRQIDGVIKADDERHLKLELEEYVITDEIALNLEKFFECYNGIGTPTGVWISGFFGSGKSHLLKIVSLVLEGRIFDGVSAAELLIEKCEDNPFLKGLIQKAASHPARSVLFNIDQRAPVQSKQDFDALLAVFQIVFDDMRGYYGRQAYIARFERDLDKEGHLDAFKTAFQTHAGKPWEKGRETPPFVKKHITAAFSEVTGQKNAPSDILDDYRKDYSLSIDDFASEVKTYIDEQGRDFRLNFFVDEVGQYVADNVKLMTNLQSIAESLLVKCDGRAWLLVTAQQDLEAVLGELPTNQQNDFSKIKGRFPTAMSLNSKDVAEVIQKRLLDKTPEAVDELSIIYDREKGNFGTLFRFSDNSRTFTDFSDVSHFTSSYPFIPYQYDLFEESIKGLSRHGAFQGRYSSVGERSMLAVFQEVAKEIADLPVGNIASFDRMFDGLRSSLTMEAISSVQLAERTLKDTPLVVRVLKALFLVKYVDEFTASLDNITILMRDRFEENSAELRASVQEALAVLEQQSYVQRQGDTYDFLTDEEKDVEKEIKDIGLDGSEINKALDELLFTKIIDQTKISHAAGHKYPFGRYIDGSQIGTTQALSIHFVTPFANTQNTAEEVRAASTTSDALFVLLDQDPRFLADVQQLQKTTKYIKQNQGSRAQTSREKIINEKAALNQARERSIIERAHELVGEARLFVRGSEQDIGTTNAMRRVEEGFQELITKVFTNLPQLRGQAYREDQVKEFALPESDDLDTNLTEAQNSVLQFVTLSKKKGINTPVSAVIEHFENIPYGWPYPAILCQVAGLIGRGKLDASLDSNILAGADLVAKMKNRASQRQILLLSRADFASSDIAKLKQFFADLFGKPLSAMDAKKVAEETILGLREFKSEAKHLTVRAQDYPFASQMKDAVEQISHFSDKPYDWYLTEFSAHHDKLLELKEQVIDPASAFLGGPQQSIYDEARLFIQTRTSDLEAAELQKVESVRQTLDDPECLRGSAMKSLKGIIDQLRTAADQKLSSARAKAKDELSDMKAKLRSLADYDARPEATRMEADALIDSGQACLTSCATSTEIEVQLRRIRQNEYKSAIELLSGPTDGKGNPEIKDAADNAIGSIVMIGDLSSASKAVLANEEDVTAYIQDLDTKLRDAVKAGKKVML